MAWQRLETAIPLEQELSPRSGLLSQLPFH
jgi:hypothetical protein